MIDGGLARFKGPRHAHLFGHMAREVSPGLGGRLHGRVEFLAGQSPQHLDEIVSGRRLIEHELPGFIRPVDDVAAQRRPGGDEPRAEYLVTGELPAQFDVPLAPLHPAHGGHAVGDVQEQNVFEVLPVRQARYVAVHFGQSRHEVKAGCIDHDGVGGYDNRVLWTDRRNSPVDNQHSLPRGYLVGVQGYEVDALKHEGWILLRSRNRRKQGKCPKYRLSSHRSPFSSLCFKKARTGFRPFAPVCEKTCRETSSSEAHTRIDGHKATERIEECRNRVAVARRSTRIQIHFVGTRIVGAPEIP